MRGTAGGMKVVILCLVVSVACKGDSASSTKVDPAPPTKAPAATKIAADAPPASGSSGTFDGKPVSYVSATAGRIQIQGTDYSILVSLYTQKLDCDTSSSAGLAAKETLRIDFNEGPDRSFYVGQPFAPRLRIGEESFYERPAASATVKLEPFEPKTGARIKGTLVVDAKVDGKALKVDTRFDAQLCQDFPTRKPLLPATVPDAPVTGHLGNEKFTAASAVAELAHDPALDIDAITELWLLPTPPRSCAEFWETRWKAAALHFDHFGGANARQMWPGVAQPADPKFTVPKGDGLKSWDGYGVAWVKFETIDLKPGGTVKGSLAVASRADVNFPAASFAGAFTATVCKR
jgi:hypothetical protein